MIGDKKGGLPTVKIEARMAGLPTSFDDPRQQVRLRGSALVAPRVVPTGLSCRAKELLGDAVLADLTMLQG